MLRRIKLRKAKNIFFYSLPDDRQIFVDLVKLLDYDLAKENQGYNAVIALFSRIERLKIGY